MQEFPLDKIISDLKAQGKDPKKFFQLFLELKDSVYFFATLKGIEKELKEYQDLIFNILKPSIDAETRKAKSLYSFKPSKQLIYKDTKKPVKLMGFRDTHRKNFIELSYIGLYHKIENAEKILLEHLNKVLSTNYSDLSELNFDSKDKVLFASRDRLRVVANCFKHNMGKANQQVCNHYPKMNLNRAIELNFVDFKKDITAIKQYYKQLNVFFVLFSQRKLMDKLLSHDIFNDSENLKASILDLNQESDKLLKILSTQNIFKKSGS